MNVSRLLLLLVFSASCALSQTTPDMATGLSPYAAYIPSEIDNINPANGNIFIKIPLLGYPQKGGKLRMNYYIYYNDKQWQANLFYTQPAYGDPYVSSLGLLPAGVLYGGRSPAPSPVGVYVARDQYLGFGASYNQTKVQTIGLGSDQIVESASYLTEYVYTSDGAIHYTGDGVNEKVGCGPLVGGNACPTTPSWGDDQFINTYPATDGSGYIGNLDPDGNTYTSSSVTDPNGNTIKWSSTGWTDSMGRFIPGGNTGPGADQFPRASGTYTTSSGFFDLIPGTILYQIPSECPVGTSAARSWSVPASTSNGGSATYYLCYGFLNYQTSFNLSTQLVAQTGYYYPSDVNSSSGFGPALLLTAVVLPDLNMYTFQYDQYLSLSQISLPTGGTIAYTWQNVAFHPMPGGSAYWGGYSNPVSRALASRTVIPGNGQPAVTTNYEWNITTSYTSTGTNWNQGVAFPAYSVVTDTNGNDTEYTLGGADDYGQMWADFVVTGVTSYSGCSPHHTNCSAGTGIRMKATTNGLTAVTSGGAPIVSPAYVPQSPNFPPTKVTQVTTHLPATGGDKLARVKNTLTSAYGSCTVYYYPFYYTVGPSQPFPSYTRSGCYQTGQIASTASFDYGAAGSGSPGSLLKTESISYAWQNSSSVLAANMLNLVAYDTITDGSANWAAETDRCYDAYGNNTNVQKLAGKPASYSCTSPPANALVSSATFTSGVVQSTTDARNNTTTLSNFACNGALPQTVTLPDGNQTKYLYDCNTGKVTSVQDQNDINNSVATTYTYADSLDRVTAARYPDGGSVSVNYNSDALPLTMTVTHQTGETSGPNVTTKIYDGLARINHTQTSDGLMGMSDTLYSDTNYDNLGRVSTESNPYRSTSDATYGITTTQYDAIGRKLQVINADQTYQTFSYDGSTVTLKDESGNQWKKTTDVLGRLTQVIEPSSTTPSATLPTNYSYDALGNLKSVNQVGILGTDTARNRFFSYDSFSRLLVAINSENGTVCFGLWSGGSVGSGSCQKGYDGNGNLIAKTDARGVVTTMTYDLLNRMLTKSFSSDRSNTPSSCYQYGTSSSSSSSANLVGRLVNAWTQVGSCPSTPPSTGFVTMKAILGYDAMGRLTVEQNCTPLNCNSKQMYPSKYSYDLAGNIRSSDNGIPSSPIIWTYSYDAAARPTNVSATSLWTDPQYPASLFNATLYGPIGITNWTLGPLDSPAVSLTKSYDVRIRPLSMSASGFK